VVLRPAHPGQRARGALCRIVQRLDLEAATPEAVYRRIELWVDDAGYAPIKARFYGDSGRLLKTAFYRRYRQELGALRPTETVIIDGIDSRWITVLRYDNFATRDIPDAWLQRDHLPNFVP
jgi:Outer membrane lipoprotein-sorting protein